MLSSRLVVLIGLRRPAAMCGSLRHNPDHQTIDYNTAADSICSQTAIEKDCPPLPSVSVIVTLAPPPASPRQEPPQRRWAGPAGLGHPPVALLLANAQTRFTQSPLRSEGRPLLF